jgi:hypothetical protein
MTVEPSFRAARRDDLPALVRLLADDMLGESRERPAIRCPRATARRSTPSSATRTTSWSLRVVGGNRRKARLRSG